MKQCLKIIVEGKVQGVGYRELVHKKAEKYSIEGTIQNGNDGTVIIHACGLSEDLDKLIDDLYKGTAKSEVKNIAVEPFVKEKDFRNVFRIIGGE